jgi:hypothetical protein
MARSANAARLLWSSIALATLLLHANRTAAVEATIDVVGACPDADAVRHLLAALLSADEASAAPLSIQDRGARFRIRVRKTEMMIDDPGRDCAARARQAAVVAANELQQRHTVLGPPTWVVEKGFVFDAASTSTGIVWAPGAEIRGVWGSQTLAMFAAAGARGPVTLPLANGWRVEELRFPLDAGARFTSYRFRRLRPWFMVGPSLTITGLLGQELVQTDRKWRLDWGAIAMAGATLRFFNRVGGLAAISLRWQPRPYELEVIPFGRAGETPTWWLGISLNYTLDGKRSVPP